MPKPSQKLRAAIEASKFSRYRLAKMTGVDEATLSRFMAGADIRTTTVDLLADALGLELVEKSRPRKKGR